MRVIGMAEKYVKKNKIEKGQIWCVYEKDSFPAKDFNGVVQRAERLNQENPDVQYHAAWSNECIEFWFLLHFAYYTANNHRTEYIAFLNDKFRELGIGKYQKNMKDIFNILMVLGVASAINPVALIRENIIDIVILIVFSLIVWIYAATKQRISRKEGISMVCMYLIYAGYIIWR